jgi:uncharacterized protein
MDKKSGNGEYSSPISFPCDFSLKVMGKSSAEFVNMAVAIVRQHFPDFNVETQLQKRFSQFTKYISLTITVHAESQEQLDNLYRQLSSTPEILVVL